MKLDRRYRNEIVSSGTLDVDRLVYNCFGFLRSLRFDPATAERLAAAEQRLSASVYMNEDPHQPDKMQVLLDDIFQILEDISPRGCFFGIHPGDPGRLGFWDKSVKFNPG